jgi:glycerophosphoryl diester phosphodiesterase
MFHQLTRRTVVGGLISATMLPAAASGAAADLRLIAHRGGVVDERLAENSAASLEEAIRRGYWMAEVDVRRSKDGVLVVNHDADFQRYFGDPRKLEEMTWEEMKGLRATPGGARPLSFAELCAVAKGRIRLMLDI